jgi:hypothetical protein
MLNTPIIINNVPNKPENRTPRGRFTNFDMICSLKLSRVIKTPIIINIKPNILFPFDFFNILSAFFPSIMCPQKLHLYS